MSTILESSDLQFILNPAKGTWSLHSSEKGGSSLEDVWMRVNYHMGISSLLRTRKRNFQFIEKWYKPQISTVNDRSARHGEFKKIIVEMGPDVNGINYHIEYVLLDKHPLFLWRLKLDNNGQRPIRVGKLEMLRAGFFPKRKLLPSPGPLSGLVRTKPVGYGAVRPAPDPGDLGFYSNGWGSWSYSGTYSSDDSYRGTRFGRLASPIYYSSGITPGRKQGIFTSDMFGVLGDKSNRAGILVGFLSQLQHFGSLGASINDPLYPALSLSADGDRAVLNPGSSQTTDWAVIQFVNLDDPEPLAPYLDAVAREYHLEPSEKLTKPPVGWCSWYEYFENIDQEKMQQNLHSAIKMQSSIPLELFQIDDGFEETIGDWFEFSPGFSEGLAPIAREIKSSGMTPGLWLAPFIVHSRSKLARKKRKWFVRNRLGFSASAGFIWNNFTKALDLTNPEALGYVRDVLRTAVEEWGYPYLKLDFLYAGAIKGIYKDRTKTRAQILRSGFDEIRKVVGPDVMLLGCGVPIGSAVGIFDVVRIGADVAPTWLPDFILPQALTSDEPNLPSTRNALQNTISRAFFHNKWWINDPDCLLVRPDSQLTLAEVRSLATAIALTGGSLLLSDDLSKLPGERLRIVEQLIPLIGKSPRVMDWFDNPTPALLRLDLENQTGKWHLLGVFNWSDEPVDMSISLSSFDLPAGEYYIRDFWEGSVVKVSDGALDAKTIPAHGVKLVSLRPHQTTAPVYLGSSFHISQGLEVVEWSISPDSGINLRLEKPGEAHGVLDIMTPQPINDVTCGHNKVEWQQDESGYIRLRLDFDKSVQIEII